MAHNYEAAEHYADQGAKRVYISGGATINAVVNTGATEPVQLDASSAWIGLATVKLGAAIPAGTSYIGLATVNVGSAIPAGTNSIGFATVAMSNPTIYAVVNTGEVALATVAVGSSATIYAVVNTGEVSLGTVAVGSSATLYAVVNTAAAGQSSVVLDTGANWVGLATVGVGAGVAQMGSVTVSSIKAGIDQIGSVTVSNWNYPQSGYTVFSGTYSASGFNTIFTPATNTHFYVKDIVMSSLGTGWYGIKSGATNTPLFPTFTFNPGGGAVMNFGDSGLRSLATSDAFVLDIQGTATISLMVNTRFSN